MILYQITIDGIATKYIFSNSEVNKRDNTIEQLSAIYANCLITYLTIKL